MRLIDTWREKRRHRRAYRQLTSFSDHILSDIGVTRTDLDSMRRGRGLGER